MQSVFACRQTTRVTSQHFASLKEQSGLVHRARIHRVDRDGRSCGRSWLKPRRVLSTNGVAGRSGARNASVGRLFPVTSVSRRDCALEDVVSRSKGGRGGGENERVHVSRTEREGR